MICSISNIRLTNALLIQLENSKIATLLLYNWLTYVGPYDFQGHLLTEAVRNDIYKQLNLRIDFTVQSDSDTEDEYDEYDIVYTPNKYKDPDLLDQLKHKFLQNEFDNLIETIARTEEAFDTSAVLYLKIIIGFSLQFDALFTVNQLIRLRNLLDVLLMDFTSLEISTNQNIDVILDRISDCQDTIQVVLSTLMKENSYDSVISMINMIGKTPNNINILATLALIG